MFDLLEAAFSSLEGCVSTLGAQSTDNVLPVSETHLCSAFAGLLTPCGQVLLSESAGMAVFYFRLKCILRQIADALTCQASLLQLCSAPCPGAQRGEKPVENLGYDLQGEGDRHLVTSETLV